MQDDNILVEMRTDIGIIKHDVENLVESSKANQQSSKNAYDDLKKDYYDINKRVTKIETELLVKKNTLSTWISPMVTPVFTAIIFGGFYEIAHHLN